jgi:hypothetical protein
MLMPLGRNRSAESEVSLSYLPFPVPGHIAMRRIGGCDEKEWLFALRRVVDKPIDFGSQDVSGVLAGVADRLVLVPLKGAVQVLIRERIKEEVLLVSASDGEALCFEMLTDAVKPATYGSK